MSIDRFPVGKILLLGALLAACKPTQQSRILEVGGDPAAWRMTSTLTSRGELRLERTGTGATDAVNKFTRVDLIAATVPDGTIDSGRLVSKRWIALTQGTQDLTFNVL